MELRLPGGRISSKVKIRSLAKGICEMPLGRWTECVARGSCPPEASKALATTKLEFSTVSTKPNKESRKSDVTHTSRNTRVAASLLLLQKGYGCCSSSGWQSGDKQASRDCCLGESLSQHCHLVGCCVCHQILMLSVEVLVN